MRGDLFVDLVVPMSSSLVLAITQFWSTAVMNYISPDGICIMYPHLTFSRRLLVNPAWLTTHGTCAAHTQFLATKYHQRGFEILIAQSQPLGNRIGPYFSGTRHKEDDQALTLRWGNGPLRTRLGLAVTPNTEVLTWFLGGWFGTQLDHGVAFLSDGEGHLKEAYSYSADRDDTEDSDHE